MSALVSSLQEAEGQAQVRLALPICLFVYIPVLNGNFTMHSARDHLSQNVCVVLLLTRNRDPRPSKINLPVCLLVYVPAWRTVYCIMKETPCYKVQHANCAHSSPCTRNRKPLSVSLFVYIPVVTTVSWILRATELIAIVRKFYYWCWPLNRSLIIDMSIIQSFNISFILSSAIIHSHLHS